MNIFRLDKIICDSGAATRSEARALIASGRVRVDGRAVTDAGYRTDAEGSAITIDGRAVNAGEFRYLMLNKPEGVLSATEDKEQKTVLDLLPPEYKKLGLFPVGRLDKDTTGLLILTNDGDFCHAATSPKRHVEKLYEFTAEDQLDEADAKAFLEGIVLKDGTKCLPAVLEIDGNDLSHGFITVLEGKYHQVKRMLAARGRHVRTLKRLAIGGLRLDESLEPGKFRELTKNDVDKVVNRNVTK